MSSLSRADLDKLHKPANSLTLVLWLSEEDINAIRPDIFDGFKIHSVYLSSSFTGGLNQPPPITLNRDHYFLHQIRLPAMLPKALTRANICSNARWLKYSDEMVMANAYFSATIAADVLRHICNNLTREYFIERIEHAFENALFQSVYPH